MNTSRLPDAILFDMDGTIVDTEPYWMLAESELVTSHGPGEWSSEDGLNMVGLALEDAAAKLQDKGVQLSKSSIIDRMTTSVCGRLSDEIPWRPGARELLHEIRQAGVKTALVTMSYARMANLVASAMGFDAFDVVVSGDSVAHGKPHPEPYLKGAELLGVDPQRCVSFEDSPTGLSSAVAAGTVPIFVPNMVDLPASPDYTIWSTLSGKTLQNVADLFTEQREQV